MATLVAFFYGKGKDMKKKILYMIIAFTLIGLYSFIITPKVKAAQGVTLTEEFMPNIYFVRRGGGKPYQSLQYAIYTLDGKVAYCIQPGIEIVTTSYIAYDGLMASPYDAATNKKIELIGHYGYDYPGHQTLRYRMAAQALIWETVSGQIIEYWTGQSGWGDYINVDYERNEIMKLVNAHYNKPSFNGTTIEAVVGKEIVITDTNNLLGEYEIYKSDGFDVRIEDNKIYATALEPGNLNLSVVRKHYDNFTNIIYHGSIASSQKMGYFRFSDPVLASLNVKSIGGDVEINKLDNDTQLSKAQGTEATLKGATYGIYNYSDTLIATITTNEDGKAKSDILSDIGEYYLKEITPSKGYELDNNKYYFNITVENLHPVINVYEQIIKRDVEINKYYAKGDTGILVPEEDIEFAIYDSVGNLVTTIKTNEQGYVKTNLVYGTYIVKQINSTPGYEKVEDFKIIVNNESPNTIKYSLTDAPIKAKLKLVKIDANTNKPILFKGATFKIKNVDTEEYVCQKVSYPNKEEICTFSTNEFGEFITPSDLISGTYQIEEIISPNGYLLSTEPYTFRIDETSRFVEDDEYGKYVYVEFANKIIKGNIIVEKTGETFNFLDKTFNYNLKGLIDVEFALYAGEDIATLDGTLHYKKGDKINTIKTDMNGIATFSDLYLGKYILKEIKTQSNYVIDTNEYVIELTEKEKNTILVSETLKITNKLKKGTLEFTKTDLVSGELIPNTIIEIYTESGECIFIGETDHNGKIIVSNLPIGKYYIIEKEAATGYVINDEKVEFEILEDGKIVKAEMTNKPITGELEFTKIDISTSAPLPNTIIEIYTENDELVFNGKTDENGQVVIKELKYGKYYILEKEAPDGYILNEEKMYFEILEDGEIVKAKMTNEKVIINVPNTGINDYHVIEIIGGLFLLCGVGIIIYAKKKK